MSSMLDAISARRDAALDLRRDARLLADEPYDAYDAAGLWDQKFLAARQAWESSLKKNPTVAFETWDWREVGEQIRGIIDPASGDAVASGVQGPEEESPGRALLYLGALTALVLLVLSYIWVSSSGSGFFYVSTIAAAMAAAAFSFEALRTWPATRPASWRAPFAAIAPLVLLVIGFWALMLRDPRLPGGGSGAGGQRDSPARGNRLGSDIVRPSAAYPARGVRPRDHPRERAERRLCAAAR